ncbi:cation diffusion facilitator family transporter [Nitrosomonas sp. PY1]|uniref:cation diffusion facilitator family transporter n=1 Tax=Nitrosomonas sp. PY1 TaxID=1803906 RepID=UPI001FC7E9C6|nr:cation diffusion facilitator family transporter [Nitrosomonas sp. PY1]GKS70269.1 cation diffusion facilitator family transporter [Nitrosomonas sp. PY1]
MNMLQQRYREIRRVTLIGSALDFSLGTAKIVIGWIANSQALVADGVHSLSDLLTDFMVLYAAKHSHKEADSEHPYGHGRIETLATASLGLVLVVVAFGIGYHSIQRLNDNETVVEFSVLALSIALISVLTKEWIYRYTVSAARRLRSDMLMANAWHSRSDAFSSMVVLVGIIGVALGHAYLDAIAAVIVAAMIAKIGIDLLRSSIQELIDSALEPEKVALLRQQIVAVDGVRSVHMLRTRKSAGNILVDVHIQVDPRLSVSEGHRIGDVVRQSLLSQADGITDVTIHIDPENDEIMDYCGQLPLREHVIQALKQQWTDLPSTAIENVTLHYLSGGIDVELDLPIEILPSILDAKKQADTLKQAAETLTYIREIQVRFKP